MAVRTTIIAYRQLNSNSRTRTRTCKEGTSCKARIHYVDERWKSGMDRIRYQNVVAIKNGNKKNNNKIGQLNFAYSEINLF